MVDLAMLDIKRLISHVVPRRQPNDVLPRLSESEPVLDDSTRLHIKAKVIQTSKSRFACNVLLDDQSTSPIPGFVSTLMGTNSSSDFVSLSRRMAEHLFQSQTGVNSDGLLTVITGDLGKKPVVALLKLDKEAGLQWEEVEVNGKHTISFKRVDGLTLTQTMKVFKAAVFIEDGVVPLKAKGIVSDHQRSYGARSQVADFFLGKFLGCRLAEEPTVTTRKFYEAVEEFINNSITDPELKGRYQIALVAELTSGEATISPVDFARDHLEVDHRSSLVSLLEARGIPVGGIDKDASLIGDRLRYVHVGFDSGLKVTGPKDAFADRVTMTEGEGGLTRLVLSDKLKVLGSGR
ncbi:MAG: nucleoid-associated protein [Chloroflexota bacterium]